MNLKALCLVGMLVATATLGACSDDGIDSSPPATGGSAGSNGRGGSANTGGSSTGTGGSGGQSSTSAVAACKAYCTARAATSGDCAMTQTACEQYSSCKDQDTNPDGFPNCAAASKAYWDCLLEQKDICTAKETCAKEGDTVATSCHD